jgi:hypothetical protein
MASKSEVQHLVLELRAKAASLPPSAQADDIRRDIEVLIGILGFEIAREPRPAA